METGAIILFILGFIGWFSYNHYEDYAKYHWYLISIIVISYIAISIHPFILDNVESMIEDSIELTKNQKETIREIFNKHKIKWSVSLIYYSISVGLLFVFQQSPNLIKNHPYNNRQINNDKPPK